MKFQCQLSKYKIWNKNIIYLIKIEFLSRSCYQNLLLGNIQEMCKKQILDFNKNQYLKKAILINSTFVNVFMNSTNTNTKEWVPLALTSTQCFGRKATNLEKLQLQ